MRPFNHADRRQTPALQVQDLEERLVLTTFVVNSALDGTVDYTDNLVTLREAVAAANGDFAAEAGGAAGEADGDVIRFDPSVSAITLTAGDLSITDDLTIDGPDALVDGGGVSRIFSIDAAGGTGAVQAVTIAGLTLTGGNGTGMLAANDGRGGAVHVASGSDLTLDGTTVELNTASGDDADDGGGGIYNDGGTLTVDGGSVSSNLAGGASGSGGGIFSSGGTVTVTDALVSTNEANRAGGGIEVVDGTVTLTGVNLLNNFAGPLDGPMAGAPGNGGGLHVTGMDGTQVSVTGGLVAQNEAASEGGGLWNQAGSTMTVDGVEFADNLALGDAADQGGGGIFNNGGTLSVSGSTFNRNLALGDLDDDTTTDTGDDTTAALGNGGGILNAAGGTLTVTGSSFTGNEADRAGGGIENVGTAMLTDVDFDGNRAGINGGGLHIGGSGTAHVIGGSFTDNTADNEGGGLWNSAAGILNVDGTSITGNTAVTGGGVYQQGGDDGTTQPTELTVTVRNLAPDDGPGDSGLFLTPVFVSFHDGTFDLYTDGQAVTEGFERLVEDGATNPLAAEFMAGNPMGVAGALPGGLGDFPPPAVLAPGATASMTFTVDPASNRFFSYATMVIPSNDAFIANGDPMAFMLYDSDGDFTGPLSFTVGGDVVLDAGTEVNTEMDAAFFDQMMADAGVAEGGVVTEHPGFMGSEDNPSGTQTILGGTQSVGPMRTFGVENADFTRDGYPLLQVTVSAAGTTTINNATITGNTATGDMAGQGGGGIAVGEPGPDGAGGAVTVTNSTISDNEATGAAGSGGGILSRNGTLTVSDTTIAGNTANRAGGGIEVGGSTVSLTGVTLDGNSVATNPGNGGGLHVTFDADVTVTDSIVTDNTAGQEGGGLWNSATGTMTVTGTSFTGNSALADDGDDTNTDQGGGAVFNLGTLTVADSTFTDNAADQNLGNGGAIMNIGGNADATVDRSVFLGNSAVRAGGAIENAGGALTVTDSAFGVDANDGDGDFTFSANTAGVNGGAIHTAGDASNSVARSTFIGNVAGNEGGGLWAGAGASLDAVNSTFGGNTATEGGGVYSTGGADVTVTASTFWANDASDAASGDHLVADGGTLTLENSVTTMSAGPDTSGVTSGGFNHITNDAGFAALPSDQVGADAMLGGLADNGGFAPTYAPLPGSPLVDAGDSFGLTVDQTGSDRTVDNVGVANKAGGDGTDIGSVEIQDDGDDRLKVAGNGVFTAPGPDGRTIQVDAQLASRGGEFENSFGFFTVDDADGAIDGLSPGDDGYVDAALARAVTLFDSTEAEGALDSFTVMGGQSVGFFLIQDGTLEQAIAGDKIPLFSIADANPGGFGQVQQGDGDQPGECRLSFEDIAGGGDADFNDLVVDLTFTDQGTGEACEVPGAAGTDTRITFEIDTRQGEFANSAGVFTVDDSSGTIDGVAPGEDGYNEAVLSRTIQLFDGDDPVGTTATITLPAGTRFGFVLVQDGEFSDLTDADPDNDPIVFTSFAAGNPEGFDNVRATDLAGGGKRIDMEDIAGGGDMDFDDLDLLVTFDTDDDTGGGDTDDGDTSDGVGAEAAMIDAALRGIDLGAEMDEVLL